jgi:hypothetical protein
VIAGRESREDVAARGVGQRREGVIERPGVMVNHMVYYER